MGFTTDVLSEGVIEHDSMLWKPSRDSTVTADDFIAARTLFIELNLDAVWNPRIRDERKDDIDGAAEIMGQWQRVELGHRRLTIKRWEAQQARRERQQEKQRARDEARREHDKAGYDEHRATARLRLMRSSRASTTRSPNWPGTATAPGSRPWTRTAGRRGSTSWRRTSSDSRERLSS